MDRRWIVGLVLLFALLNEVACSDSGRDPAQTGRSPSSGAGQTTASTDPVATDTAPSVESSGPMVVGPEGRIAFQRHDPTINGPVTYTVNPDGSDVRPLFLDGGSEMPRWSPDGTLIHIFCCGDGMAAHLLDPFSDVLRALEQPDPDLELHCGEWSRDGERLACEGYGVDDPSLTGIYSVRASDGGDPTRVTSPPGGYDTPGDYSPDGTRMVFARFDDEGHSLGLYVIGVDGTGMRKISGKVVDDLSPGRWSPTGEQILFAGRKSDEHHKTIWVVNADGSSLHEMQVDSACGGLWSDPDAIGCYSPAWSPDGTRIVYVRSTPEGEDAGIFVANADGTGSVQLTDGEDDQPDWGSPPAA